MDNEPEKNEISNKLRFLVLDDLEPTRDQYKKAFDEHGEIRYLILSSPLDLDIRRQEIIQLNPNLFIVDLYIGEFEDEGYDLIKKIRSCFPEVPVVVCSIILDKKKAARCKKMGCKDAIFKGDPFVPPVKQFISYAARS